MPDPVDPPAPAPKADPPEPKSFSQEDVDRIVQDRIARVKTEPPADYADLQAAAQKLADLEAANKTDLEKAQARADTAEAAATTATERAERILREASLVSAAATAGAVDPETVALLLAASDAVTVTDGKVTGAADAVKQLLEDKPFLKTTGRPQGDADGGSRPPGPDQLTREALKTMTPEAIVEAKAKGQLNDLLGVKP